MMYLFCREAVGDGGFQAELAHYSAIAEKGPARYMSTHLQMLGYHVSPQQDMEALLPRKMFVHVYPDDPHNHNACATVTYADTRRDGSGVICIDYADVYRGRRLRPDGRKGMRMYSRYGNIRQDEAFVDLGITGMRSIGVDYSGRSGAPCLVAIVDRVHGGGRKIWTWQLPKGSKEAPRDVQRTTFKGNSFTVLKADGASLHGIFVSGQRPVAEVRMTTMTGGGGSTSGKTLERPIHGVFAETQNKNADFFFVGTIQRGEPPEIRVSGQGIDAIVNVGGQQIRFDGEKIVFESKK
jgi:hypothetical protein